MAKVKVTVEMLVAVLMSVVKLTEANAKVFAAKLFQEKTPAVRAKNEADLVEYVTWLNTPKGKKATTFQYTWEREAEKKKAAAGPSVEEQLNQGKNQDMDNWKRLLYPVVQMARGNILPWNLNEAVTYAKAHAAFSKAIQKPKTFEGFAAVLAQYVNTVGGAEVINRILELASLNKEPRKYESSDTIDISGLSHKAAREVRKQARAEQWGEYWSMFGPADIKNAPKGEDLRKIILSVIAEVAARDLQFDEE